MLKLHVFLGAPNPTRVRLYLAEKAAAGTPIAVEQVMVNLLEGEQKRPEHLARNPLGKLPVLEFEDGTFLTESLAIIEYFEECHPEPPMIGGDARTRARVRELERIAEVGVLRNVAGLVHATNSPLGMPPAPVVAEHHRRMLPANLALLDGVLTDGRPFLAGERPSVADCTLQAAFQFGRFRAVDVTAGFERLVRWDAAYRERAPAQSVLIA